MSKDAFWFKHDSNASRDLRVMEIKAIYGYEGIGIFWAIIEVLREQDGYYWDATKINVLSAILGVDETRLTNIITDCKRNGLLKHTENKLYSNRLLNDMKVWETKRDNGRKTTGNKKPKKRKHTENDTEMDTKSIPLKKTILNLNELIDGYKNIYTIQMITDFYEYWSEKDKKGNEKWAKKDTWETSKRLARWYRNNISNKSTPKEEVRKSIPDIE